MQYICHDGINMALEIHMNSLVLDPHSSAPCLPVAV